MSDFLVAYGWPLFCSYLWILGGLHWTFQYEAEQETEISTLKRGVMIVLFPVMTCIALVTTLVIVVNHGFTTTVLGRGEEEEESRTTKGTRD